jgi:hypothetical protein
LEVLATEGTTVTSLEVVPSSAMADGFGVDWFLGSWVTVVVNDQQIRAQVVEVPISITSSDGVLVGAVVGDATGFDWQAILAAKQSKTEKRVSALEQNAEKGAAFDSTALTARTSALETADATTNKSGLVPVIPTSVTVTAGSASIASDGTITMAASVGLLAINVFSAQYRNYVMVFSAGVNISDQGAIRFGTGGTANVTSNYSYSTLYNSAGAGSHGNENSVAYIKMGYVNVTIKSHYEFKIFSPFDSGSTTGVEVLGGYSGVGDWTHGFFALNTSFTDMFVNTYNGRALTGTVKFYGYN